jgi:hypothetical protein
VGMPNESRLPMAKTSFLAANSMSERKVAAGSIGGPFDFSAREEKQRHRLCHRASPHGEAASAW